MSCEVRKHSNRIYCEIKEKAGGETYIKVRISRNQFTCSCSETVRAAAQYKHLKHRVILLVVSSIIVILF